MKAAVDLHIHSVLSPCSDNDMTPNDIVNMACLKGLDIIAITDHNSAENVNAILECAADKNILAVPGMEIETREEVHLICLFPDVESAHKMQELVYSSLPHLKNKKEIFGEQVIMDYHDNITGYCERLLLTSTGLSVKEVFDIVRSFEGAVLPAHIDRNSNSLLSNLGIIPEDLGIKYLEISKNCKFDSYIKNHPYLHKYQFIRTSDAHNLGEILERESFIDVEDISIKSLLRAIYVKS